MTSPYKLLLMRLRAIQNRMIQNEKRRKSLQDSKKQEISRNEKPKQQQETKSIPETAEEEADIHLVF